MEKIFKQSGIELSKRTYVTTEEITFKCPCGYINKTEIVNDYISYPVVGEPEDVIVMCEGCYDDIVIGTLTLNMEVVVDLDDNLVVS